MRPKVVVVGAEFGGLACARKLSGEPVDVLVLDRHNYHLFTPLLYQVATSLLNPSDIAYPLRAVFRRSPNVRFRQAAVDDVDTGRKIVRTTLGEEIPYDALVVATGSTNNYFANASLAHHTLGMKSLAEAMRLRNHVLSCLELATRAPTEAERRALLTFVVVGGGPTGVEYAGALSELLRLVLGRDYPELDPAQARIVIVEGLERLLGVFHPKLGAYAADELKAKGIEVRTSTLVESAGDDHVVLQGGERIDSRTVVWSAGVRPTDPLGEHAKERSRSKRIAVDAQLRVPGADGVYAIGDAASVKTRDGELPMLSPPAMQAGRYVARAILGRTQPPFRYVDKGTMATIGRRA
ncbi:MAG: NAD(P)/FAD-dependent oxidoreductase, partial [Actinomycetota bacterium]